MTYPHNCPHCNYLLDEGDIFEILTKEYGEKKGTEYAAFYGYTKDKPKRFSKILIKCDDDQTTCYCPNCSKIIKISEE